MPYCLIPELASKFRRMVKSGDIDLIAMQDMSSEQRRQLLSSKLGEVNSGEINALFEKKLLAKNRKNALLNFIKEVSGLTPEVRRDFIARVNKMGDLLTESDIQKYKEDLINKRLRIGVTQEQGKKIYELAKKAEDTMQEAKKIPGINNQDYDFKNETKANKDLRREAGANTAILQQYVESITEPDTKTRFKDFIKDPIRQTPTAVGNLLRAITASWDNSFVLNQGARVMANPATFTKWADVFGKSFTDIGKSLGGVDVGLAIKTEIYSRPNFINGNYTRMRLAVGLRTEEAIPTNLPEKIPLLGKIFKASNDAYNGAALRLRSDLADYFIRIQTKKGLSFEDKVQAKSFGNIVNSITGRGSTGMSKSSSDLANAVFFSPALLKSNYDAVTFYQGGDMTKEAKKAGAKYILQIVATQALLLAILKTLFPERVELDPRSTNFGGVKIGNTWFKNPVMTAGGIVPLLARSLPTMHNGKWGMWTKNTKGKYSMLIDLSDIDQGIIRPGKGFRARNVLDVFQDFATGKAAPLVSSIISIMRGRTYDKDYVDIPGLAKNVLPISPMEILKAANNPDTEFLALQAFWAIIGGSTNPDR